MLRVSRSHNRMNCIEVRDPEPRVRAIIKAAVACNWRGDERYELGSNAGAFLQSDHEDYLLIEFWGRDFQPFVDLLNRLIEEDGK